MPSTDRDNRGHERCHLAQTLIEVVDYAARALYGLLYLGHLTKHDALSLGCSGSGRESDEDHKRKNTHASFHLPAREANSNDKGVVAKTFIRGTPG